MEAEEQKKIKEALVVLRNKACSSNSDSIDDVDDILVNYVSGVLAEVSEEEEGDLDSDSFCETMIAYMPALETIGNDAILEWLFDLSDALRSAESCSTDAGCSRPLDSIPFTLHQIPKNKSDSSMEDDVNSDSKTELDPELKSTIVSKHSLVATSSKPCLPHLRAGEKASKVRYLDGKVVSTKGEKFFEIKKEESEEMKKTYIHLKHAKKYRFH